MGELVDLPARFVDDPRAFPHTPLDATRRKQLTGPCRVDWRDGIRRMVAARHPEIELRGPGKGGR